MPNTQLATRKPRAGNMAAEDHIARMVVKARAAMALYATDIAVHGQARIDEAVTALAWSIYKPQNADQTLGDDMIATYDLKAAKK